MKKQPVKKKMKSIQVNFKTDAEHLAELRSKAAKYSDGSVSLFIRMATWAYPGGHK